MADYALNKLGAKKIAIFFQNDQFGKDQRDGAVEYLKKKNMAPAAEASYVPADVDVSAQVIALRQASPDAVLLAVIPKHGSLFTSGGPANATLTVLLEIYDYAFGNSLGGDYGAATALSLMLAGFLAVFSLVYMRATRSWSTE